MQRYIYTIVCSLAFLTAIPAVQANATSVETSGGMVKTHLETQSKLENQPPNSYSEESSVNEALNDRGEKLEPSNVDKSDTSLDVPYLAYCKPLSPGLKPEDWQYKEFVYKCRYGS
jgi:hypothetical protein